MRSKRDRHPGIEIAVAEAGGFTALGKLFDPPITGSAVMMWKMVPLKYVATIHQLFGIPRHELRPDIYPPEPPELAPRRGRPRKK
jgi:hypothetical protein